MILSTLSLDIQALILTSNQVIRLQQGLDIQDLQVLIISLDIYLILILGPLSDLLKDHLIGHRNKISFRVNQDICRKSLDTYQTEGLDIRNQTDLSLMYRNQVDRVKDLDSRIEKLVNQVSIYTF